MRETDDNDVTGLSMVCCNCVTAMSKAATGAPDRVCSSWGTFDAEGQSTGWLGSNVMGKAPVSHLEAGDAGPWWANTNQARIRPADMTAELHQRAGLCICSLESPSRWLTGKRRSRASNKEGKSRAACKKEGECGRRRASLSFTFPSPANLES